LLDGLALLVDLGLGGLGFLIDHGHVLVDVFLGRTGAEAQSRRRQRQSRHGGFQSYHLALPRVPLPKLIPDHKPGRSWAEQRRQRAEAWPRLGFWRNRRLENPQTRLSA